MSGQRETIFATDSAWGNALKKKLRKISNGEKKALSFFKDVPWVEYIESKKLFIMFLRKIARWDSQTLFCLRRYPAKKKRVRWATLQLFSNRWGRIEVCENIFLPDDPPPKKNTSARPSKVGPSVIHWNSIRPLAHSLTFPFLSFIFSPQSSIPPMGYYLRGEIHAHSIFYSTRLVSLEIEVLFSPFLFFLWRIRDRKQALLLALNPLSSLSSLFAPVCFPWESGDSTDWGGGG